jgi:peptide/nickel transport system permease protein
MRYNMNIISELIKTHKSSFEELGRAAHLLRKSPLAIVGIAIVSLYLIILIFAPLIAPYGPEERIWKEAFQPPTKKHILGTDDTGGDIYSRIIWGTRTTFRIIFAIETLTLLVGITLG